MVHPRTAACIALAATLTGCSIQTEYTPRPGRVALGMKNGEPGVYKDGALVTVSTGVAMMMNCSQPAVADAGEAASHQESYKSNMTIVGFIYALSAFAPPVVGFGIYFSVRASQHQQQAFLHTVDAINRYNDEPACAPAVGVR